MNLPADMRRALGLKGSGKIILTQDENGLRITTMEQELKRVRDLARPYRPESGYASDELIAGRRLEAALEESKPRDA